MKRNELLEMKPEPAGENAASPAAPHRPWVKPAIVEEDYRATEADLGLDNLDGFGYS